VLTGWCQIFFFVLETIPEAEVTVPTVLSCVGSELKCDLGETCCSEQLEDTLMYNRTTSESSQLSLRLLDALNGCFAGSQFEGKLLLLDTFNLKEWGQYGLLDR